jgi:hypothetical protein
MIAFLKVPVSRRAYPRKEIICPVE